MARRRRVVLFLQEFSIPLIGGVFAALIAANIDKAWYDGIVHWKPIPLAAFGHAVDLHFLVNDVFMVFFFGIAAKEITESILPGGSLNPFRKAINPLLGTIGGVVGPVGAFFVLLAMFQAGGSFEGIPDEVVRRGWGIPTATDIALAWLVARTVFGGSHPAVNFLLLLAVADDAIGLVIIAVFYGDPTHPAEPVWLGLCLAGMIAAWLLRRQGVRSWVPYIAIGGPLAWCGLLMANLHPALALVFIVPFLPGPKRDTGLFVDQDEVDQAAAGAKPAHEDHSPLHNFEHDLKLFVDVGLFGFAFANAGVPFTGIGPMTWIILGALVVGKTVGIGAISWIGIKIGFPLPTGMHVKDLIMAGFVAALGLTVALFVAGAAFETSPELLGQAKMGALFTGFVGIAAIMIGRMIRIRRSE